MGRVDAQPAVVTAGATPARAGAEPAGGAGRADGGGGLDAGLALAIALALAVRETGVHVVPTTSGTWRGLVDPPGLARLLGSLVAGAGAALLLSRHPASVRRPLRVLLLAAAPALPLLTGWAPALLAFQGPAMVVVAAAALGVALVRHRGSPEGHAPAERPAPRWRAMLLFATAFLFYALLGTRIPGPAGPQGDEPHYLAMAHSLLSDGDLDLADEFARREYRGFYAGRLEPHTSPASPRGRIYSIHTPGLPVLILPAYALGGYLGARLLLSALAALTGVLVYRLVREAVGSDGLGLAAWAALILTPPLPFYAVALYPETPAALATALFLLTSRRDSGPRGVALAAVAAAALPWLHPKFLPLGALGLGLTLARRCSWRARVTAAALLSASVALLLAFFGALYGRASLAAAYGPGFSSDVSLARLPWGAAALALDRQFGLLAVAPLYALAVPGWVALFRQRAGDALRAALLGGASLAVGASFSGWWGGACPPARFVVPALPALVLALAAALRRRRAAAAALAGIGLAIVALAADAPRALHNRPDGESVLLRFLAPALDLDGLLPSFVLPSMHAPVGDRSASRSPVASVLLALTLTTALALAWARGRRGFLAGAAAYLLVAGALRERPLVDERRATLRLLEEWDALGVLAVSGPLQLGSLSVPLDLRGGPWTVGALEIRNSGRLDLPPGLYRVDVRGRALAVSPASKSTRLDLTAGALLLERAYLEEGRAGPSFPLLLPAGARRLALTAAGVAGTGIVEDVRLVPQALVPRRLRGEFSWPRQPGDDRYRVGPGEVRATALDRSARDGEGFRIGDDEGRFLVEAPPGREVRLRVQRPRPAPGDAVEWGGLRVPLAGDAEVTLELRAEGGVVLGSTAVVPVTVRSAGAWVAFAE